MPLQFRGTAWLRSGFGYGLDACGGIEGQNGCRLLAPGPWMAFACGGMYNPDRVDSAADIAMLGINAYRVLLASSSLKMLVNAES